MNKVIHLIQLLDEEKNERKSEKNGRKLGRKMRLQFLDGINFVHSMRSSLINSEKSSSYKLIQ